MEENSINSEKNYNQDSILFPALYFNSAKNYALKMKSQSNFTINNKFHTKIIDEFLLNNINEENSQNSIFNRDILQDDNQTTKLVNNYFIKKSAELLPANQDKKRNNNNYGRKKKNSTEKGAHNKYTSDNLIRKCKAVVINILSKLINKKIYEIYKDDITYSSKKKKLVKMKQFQIANSNIEFNKLFIHKKLKDIFSENLSSRCTSYSIDHNKNLVNDLLNEKDLTRRNKFQELFELTFLDCVEHLRGSKYIDILEDLEKYDKVCDNLNGDEDYKESFRCYIDNFETIINNKKSRVPYEKRKSKQVKNKK